MVWSKPENPVSSRGVVQRPSMTRGKWSNQSKPARRARREVFKERWKRSTRPLDWGWKLVVFEREMFNKEHKTPQREEVNCAPQSEVILAGTPNLEIQQEIKALVQSSAEVEDIGTASGQREVLSTMVKRWVKPLELGRGPTKSTWMWLKRLAGTGIWGIAEWTCCWTLLRWQCRQPLAQSETSLERPDQTNALETNLRVGRTPGWDRLCIASKTCRRRETGTRGRREPVESRESGSTTGPPQNIR